MALQAQFSPGQEAAALNLKYKDGTRLRAAASEGSEFNGVWVPNDTVVTIVEVSEQGAFALVRKQDEEQGWIRTRNLNAHVRVSGVTKDVVTNEVVTADPEYIQGIKIWNCGIKQDECPGTKRGKGVQSLVSTQWIQANERVHWNTLHANAGVCSLCIGPEREDSRLRLLVLDEHVQHAHEPSRCARPTFARGNRLFPHGHLVDHGRFRSDHFPFTKYTPAQRAGQRKEFYDMYLHPRAGYGTVPINECDNASILGKFSAPTSRRDLVPPIALQRLAINNELSALKYADATIQCVPASCFRLVWTHSSAISNPVHCQQMDEDHIIHLLWNFHAIYHVLVVFPEKNDVIDYSAVACAASRSFAPYEPTASLDKINSRHLPLGNVLKLDWNEGVIPPPPSVSAALISFVRAAEGTLLKWYPHLAGGTELRAQLADYSGTIPENILITNGSDDALILICHSFLGHGKTALAPVPTYEHFCVNAVGTGASLIRASCEDPFRANQVELTSQMDIHKPNLAYLVSPNNPTGVQWTDTSVRHLATRYPETLFLVDEAYYEFGATDPQTGKLISCTSLAVERTNVIVTRTFSKAFCLASVRCGYIVAHPSTIESLRAYYNPKSVNQFAQIAAFHALKEYDAYYLPYIKSTNASRESFIQTLQKQNIVVRSGGAGNFVCVQVPFGKTREVCERLEEQAIFVRDISGRFPGYVRITIGLEMSRVAENIVNIIQNLSA